MYKAHVLGVSATPAHAYGTQENLLLLHAHPRVSENILRFRDSPDRTRAALCLNGSALGSGLGGALGSGLSGGIGGGILVGPANVLQERALFGQLCGGGASIIDSLSSGYDSSLNLGTFANVLPVSSLGTADCGGGGGSSGSGNYFQQGGSGGSGTKTARKISKIPFKVLDAPQLQDDFYLNLVDWSSQNMLAVALSSCVYLWSAQSNKVIKFCDLGLADTVTSVAWHPRGGALAVGTSLGEVQIYDAVKLKRTATLSGHQARVGALAWSNALLGSGSRDKSILQRDLRADSGCVRKLQSHRQEVCGLKWSMDEQQLASGGNDNKLCVWNLHSSAPICKFAQHQAAVKALAWSPHQHGLLASGGGTADRTIRFWNTLTQTQVDWLDTGSQVCNLMFSRNVNELVSTHGYSLNQIILWKYPTMEKIADLTGHTSRVLYLSMSPDGETIVTGAGDETLRFWNVFPKRDTGARTRTSLLHPGVHDLR